MKAYKSGTMARLTIRAIEQDLYPPVMNKPFIILEKIPHKTHHYSVLCDDNKERVVNLWDMEEDL